MPNIYETLIGAPPSGPEQTKETADKLRGQEQLGMLGILTGDKVLTTFGKSMVGQVHDRVESLQGAREAGLDNARDQFRMDSQNKQWAEQNDLARQRLEEDIRDNKAKLAADELAGLVPDYTKMTDSSRTYLRDKSSLVNAGQKLMAEFQSLPTAVPGTGYFPKLGDASNWLSANVPGWTNEDMRERQAFWAKWDRTYNLKERNEMFGATLTDNEKAVWAAANINANMNSGQIQKAMMNVLQKQQKELTMYTDSMLAGGYNPNEVGVFRTAAGIEQPQQPEPQPQQPGMPPQGQPQPQPQQAPVNPATGNKIVQWDE